MSQNSISLRISHVALCHLRLAAAQWAEVNSDHPMVEHVLASIQEARVAEDHMYDDIALEVSQAVTRQ